MPQDREITVQVPKLGAGIEFSRMEGFDEISRPFSFHLLISSKDLDLKAEDVLGTGVTLTVTGDEPRYFHGLATEFGLDEIRDDFAYFRIRLQPWLWFLS
ncbi:MAG TPA: contractile injection system protein, VgrG/Pvc8 family, partial [Paracoccaceae bacterium]